MVGGRVGGRTGGRAANHGWEGLFLAVLWLGRGVSSLLEAVLCCVALRCVPLCCATFVGCFIVCRCVVVCFPGRGEGGKGLIVVRGGGGDEMGVEGGGRRRRC